MIAAMTLRFLDPFGTGKLVLFQVTYDKVCTRVRIYRILRCSSPPGLACTRIIIFLDSRGLWRKINFDCVRGTEYWSLKLLLRVYMVLGSLNSTTVGVRMFAT